MRTGRAPCPRRLAFQSNQSFHCHTCGHNQWTQNRTGQAQTQPIRCLCGVSTAPDYIQAEAAQAFSKWRRPKPAPISAADGYTPEQLAFRPHALQGSSRSCRRKGIGGGLQLRMKVSAFPISLTS
jgi:hypothetical protein